MTENKELRLADVPYENLSPMMQKYADLKLQMGDIIIFYRLGDFYECFFDDALLVSRMLELTLTARDCGSGLRAPMCGVPHHAYKSYAARLVNEGQKVAICEQLEDPAQAKGLVKRGIVQVLTPGTMTDTDELDDRKNNYLMSIMCVGNQYGIAVADITTGDFEATQLDFTGNDEHLINLIGKYNPSEIIYNPEFEESVCYKVLKQAFEISYTKRSERDFKSSPVKDNKRIKIYGDDKFKDTDLMISACAALIRYAEETQTDKVEHLNTINCFKVSETMEIDYSTRVNLELTQTIRTGAKKGSLLWAIDKTKTSMGGRLLRKWVEEPLIISSSINARLDAVEECYDRFIECHELIEGLTGLYDIERLASKVSLGSINGREMIALKNSLGKLPFLKECSSKFGKGIFRQINELLDPLEDIYDLLDRSIADDPPISITEGDIIKPGFNEECDELRDIATNANVYIAQLEVREKERTGIKTLRVGYNRVFGYYVEVPRSVTELPEEYTRKQTLANNERYISPELKTLEDKILGANSKRMTLEYQLFVKIRETVKEASDRLFGSAKAAALIDVVSSLASLASEENYVRPVVDNSNVLDIRDGRHPVVEKMLNVNKSDRFIPNDTKLDGDNRIMVLTGPNMAGKSTYMRQNAIIVLLAQMGSFVPASSAHIGLVDKIFTRIGASDDISMGQSTFMVEMKEVAGILKNATPSSLLLLDEVGRGTSTYDGLSIAWAVLEYIADPKILFARTIFATHYHELNRLEKSIRGIFNNHVDVMENDDGVVFLHKIVEGGTSDSYGIEVARLAGVPTDVLTRSRNILKELERLGEFKTSEEAELPGQDSIFNPDNVYYRKEDSIRNALREIDITRVTPLEAMNLLYGFIDTVRKEDQDEQD